jgi:hypothetical protein
MPGGSVIRFAVCSEPGWAGNSRLPEKHKFPTRDARPNKQRADGAVGNSGAGSQLFIGASLYLDYLAERLGNVYFQMGIRAELLSNFADNYKAADQKVVRRLCN